MTPSVSTLDGVRFDDVEANGRVAQLVEQGTENPRVGGSTPSLATFFIWVLPLLAACERQDRCEELCVQTTNVLATCMDDWPIGWEELGSPNRRLFRRACLNQWAEVRSTSEPRELDNALEQCDETLTDFDELRQTGELCAALRALYVDPVEGG